MQLQAGQFSEFRYDNSLAPNGEIGTMAACIWVRSQQAISGQES